MTRKRYLRGREIVVERLAAIAGVLPIAIVAFQLVFESVLLRRDEAQGSVVDFEITSQRR